MNGFTGRILHVDLNSSTTSVEEPDELFYRKYLGGSGIVGYYLLHEVPESVDPLGPDNVLVFAGGVLTGVSITGSGRNAVGAISPLTGGFGEAEVGGFFGAEMRRAGYDAIVIKGAARKPVYLWINNGEVEIKHADRLWGKSTKDCQEILKTELGDGRIRISAIGPGGENLVRYACIVNDLKHVAGRTGLGAVMGSKKLKAIAVRGKIQISTANREKILEHNKWMSSFWKERVSGLHEHGSAGNVLMLQKFGALPTRNHTENAFEGAEKVSGQAMTETILEAREGCFACPVKCKRRVKISEGAYQLDSDYGGPEYETVGAFGPNCGVDNLEAIAKANESCNAYGLDTISTGSIIALAMDCYRSGIISDEDTGGLQVEFGNAGVMVQLTEMIANRRGFGDLLADGPEALIGKFGPEVQKRFVGVKNQALPMHESRVRHGHAMGYALSPTGADHMHNFWDMAMAMDPVSEDLQGMGTYSSVKGTVLNDQKVRAYAYGSTWSWIHNMICCCMYIPWPKDRLIDIINSITGWKTNMFELMITCRRMVTVARMINLRQGLGRSDDELPEIYYKNIGPYPGVNKDDFDAGRALYYGLMGWDSNEGIPLESTLVDLDLT